MKYMLIAAALLAFLALIYLFLICPSGRRKKTQEFFRDIKYYAHRGLHGKGVPENSLAAFRLACEAGYGIELDLHITRDGGVAVFHDNTLQRMCGIEGSVEDKTLSELRGLKLAGTEQYIPSFKEVLELVNGRVPLIIEIKGETLNTEVCAKAAELLDGYSGKWCVESFNPFYVFWWRKHRKNAVRGMLACKMEPSKRIILKLRNLALGNMLFNFLAGPDFIAYDLNQDNVLSFIAARAMGGYPVAWTAHSEQDIQKAEKLFKAYIFENIDPSARHGEEGK